MQPTMRKGLSYIIPRIRVILIYKIQKIGSAPDNAVIVTTDVMVLYSSIPHDVKLKAFERNSREKRTEKNSY